MSFQSTPSNGATQRQIERVNEVAAAIARFYNCSEDGRITTSIRWSDELMPRKGAFAIVDWKLADESASDYSQIVFSGSIMLIIGPRGYVEVADFRSGTSDAKHCRGMALHFAGKFGGRVTKGCCIRK